MNYQGIATILWILLIINVERYASIHLSNFSYTEMELIREDCRNICQSIPVINKVFRRTAFFNFIQNSLAKCDGCQCRPTELSNKVPRTPCIVPVSDFMTPSRICTTACVRLNGMKYADGTAAEFYIGAHRKTTEKSMECRCYKSIKDPIDTLTLSYSTFTTNAKVENDCVMHCKSFTPPKKNNEIIAYNFFMNFGRCYCLDCALGFPLEVVRKKFALPNNNVIIRTDYDLKFDFSYNNMNIEEQELYGDLDIDKYCQTFCLKNKKKVFGMYDPSCNGCRCTSRAEPSHFIEDSILDMNMYRCHPLRSIEETKSLRCIKECHYRHPTNENFIGLPIVVKFPLPKLNCYCVDPDELYSYSELLIFPAQTPLGREVQCVNECSSVGTNLIPFLQNDNECRCFVRPITLLKQFAHTISCGYYTPQSSIDVPES